MMRSGNVYVSVPGRQEQYYNVDAKGNLTNFTGQVFGFAPGTELYIYENDGSHNFSERKIFVGVIGADNKAYYSTKYLAAKYGVVRRATGVAFDPWGFAGDE